MSHLYPDKATFLRARKAIDPQTRIGFVPTMGALHEGHASLARRSVSENDLTIASIFVNPTQFGAGEDLSRYPRTMEKDLALLKSIGVDMVFAPSVNEIYGKEPNQILFSLRDMDRKLCGASRPGHFNGVIQVVSILFNIVQPDLTYFGKKDYQQFLIIRKMAEELHFPVQPVGCPIVREADGLAMSSRNVYLATEERKQAVCLFQILNEITTRRKDFQTVEDVKDFVQKSLARFPLARLDYFEILNDENLQEVDSLSPGNHPRAFLAVFIGNTRLIDNMSIWGD